MDLLAHPHLAWLAFVHPQLGVDLLAHPHLALAYVHPHLQGVDLLARPHLAWFAYAHPETRVDLLAHALAYAHLMVAGLQAALEQVQPPAHPIF